MISRRLVLAGGGAVAVGGLGRALQQGLLPGQAPPGLEPWADWRDRRYAGPLALVSAGLLAASPHNTQPWRFAIGRLGVDVFEVPERALGAMDPFGRERLAGLGAAIHNMALASTALQRPAVVRLLPDPANPLHVARVLLGPDGQGPAPHPLLPAIGRRHTHRGGWTAAAVSDGVQRQLLAFARPAEVRIVLFAADSPRGRRFAALTDEATAAIAADTAMMADSHRWFRHSRADQQRHRDGLTLRTSGISPMLAAAAAMGPPQDAETEGRYWLAATRDTHLPTASLFGMVLVPDQHDRRQALQAGMAWQRLHLEVTRAGLVAQPLNQLPEMIDRDSQLGSRPAFARAADALLDDVAWRPTFTFRIGHADPAAESMRRPVSEVVGPPARLAWEVEQWRAAGGAF